METDRFAHKDSKEPIRITRMCDDHEHFSQLEILLSNPHPSICARSVSKIEVGAVFS